MYPSAINETLFQYTVSPPPPSSPTLDFVLDSGATKTALKDAGTLTPLPLPTQVHGADTSFSIPCTHLSTLPCSAFPSGTVIGLHIPTLHNNLLSHREIQGAGITAIYPGNASYCDLCNTAFGCFPLRIPLCPRTRLYTLRTPRPSFCQVTTRAGTSTGPLPPPPTPPRQISSSPTSYPSSSSPSPSPTPSPSSSNHLSHPAMLLHHRLGHPNFAALRTAITSRLLDSLPPTLPPLPSLPHPHAHPAFMANSNSLPITAIPLSQQLPLTLFTWTCGALIPSALARGTGTCSSSSTTTVGTLLSSSFTQRFKCWLWSLHGLSSAAHTLNAPSASFTLMQNGIAESHIRKITKIARCLLAHASTPPSLWSYALLHAALLLNLRSHPQHSSSSPTEIWSKAKPDAPGLRVWGCKAFVLIPPADRSRAAGKLASRALECVYLGHNRDSPGYLFLHPPSSRLICSIDVVFDESIPYYSTPPPDPLPPPSRPLAWTDTVLPPLLPPAPLLPPVTAPLPPSSSADIYDPSAPASPAHSAAPPPHSPSSSHSPPRPQGQQPQQQQPVQQQSGQQPQHQPVQQQQQQPGQQQQRRATSRSSPFLLLRMHTRSLDKLIGAPPLASIQLLKDSHEEFLNIRQHTPFLASLYLDFLGFPVLGATSTPTIFTPTTFHEAITCTDADKWIAANFLECEAFIRNDSFVDVPLPAEANLVEDKWVFRVKTLPGEELVYKACYCA
ncbi:unnamed protein product [Closterium sp. NIES-53]